MNKNLYRIVFNKARGLLMAVAETAKSHSSDVGTTEGVVNRINLPSLIATLRPLAFSLLLALGAVGVVTDVAHAGIVADGSAPSNQQPIILNAANGVPQVNIQTPSAAGVSRNTYTQFDVQQQGVILNNSRTDVQTQLGGYVQANPYLATGAARVILNEVNSNNPSLLQGYIEVAGSRAQVVIANPAGVTCDGCGFINANRATLTTGTPILNGGSLDGYRVQRGTVSINGNGLDASQTDYTDIIARAVQVNASIYANDLRVTAGSNQVNTANTTATPIAGTGTTPTLAIDVAQLGGMYAGKIQLIGTEAGVGVTNAGQIGASAGNVVVNVNGQLTNSGTISSTANNSIQADSITNTNGTITAGQLLSINANSLTGDGSVLSDSDIAVQLTTDYTSTGQLLANGNLTFTTTGNFSNQSDILAGNLLTLTAANIDNTAGHEISGSNTHLTASNTLTNRGLIDGSDTFINTATLNNIGTGSIFGDHVALQATTLTNDVETVNSTTTAAVIAARNSMDIGTTTLNNREHSLIFSSGNIAIGGSLDASHLANGSATVVNNNSATINALGALNLSADQVSNTNEHFTTQVVDLSTSFYQLWQSASPIHDPNNLHSMGTLWTASQVTILPASTNEVDILASADGSTDHFIRYDINETISETQVLSSDPGQILAGGSMLITANNVLNDKSQIIAGTSLTGNIGTLNNTTVAGQHIITDTGLARNYFRIPEDGRDSQGLTTSGYNPAPTVQSINLTPTAYEVAPTTGGQVATISTLNTTLPNSGLFQPNPNPSANYLVETNPRFANYRTWLSSDYLLQQLSFDPATTQKRIGDGFYEQSLVRDQVAQLTGRRFLDGYASDEAEYQGLLSNAVTVAKAWNLVPGVALSSEQVAQLTSDIVWLVQKTVTLPDGTTTQALVPQLYVSVQPGDLNGSGALISGNTVNLNISGDLNNSGSIAGRTVLALNAVNVNNMGGNITATDVNLNASNDINNIGGTISGKDSLSATAGRDLNVESTTSTQTNSQGYTTNINRVAGLYVSNADATLIATAGRDVNLNAAQINNSGADTNGTGGTLIQAANNLNIGTVTTGNQENIVWNSKNHISQGGTAEVGSNIQTNGNVSLIAAQDINAKAATVTSDNGNISAIAGNNVNLTSGQATQNLDASFQTKGHGFLSSKTITTHDVINKTNSEGTTLSGDTVTVLAGYNPDQNGQLQQTTGSGNITVQGSNVISTNETIVNGTGNVTVTTAQNTDNETHLRDTKKSGLLGGGGGIGFTIGTQQLTNTGTSQTTTNTASTVGSTAGDVNINTGKTYTQTGSDVLAPAGNVNITAQSVDINAAENTSVNTQQTKFKQTGLSVSISNPVVSAVQTTQQMATAASQTSDGRMQALAGATTALSIKNAAKSVTDNPSSLGGIDVSISLGTSKSQSDSTQTSSTAQGSNVTAGKDINIRATGAGANSNLNVVGSTIKAANSVTLKADNQINLLAAQNNDTETSTNKSSSASVGVSVGTHGLAVTASMSKGKGNANGTDVSYTNTQVIAGNQAGDKATLQSGTDTNLIGATVQGNQVVADVGTSGTGNLNIQSLQDTSTYNSKQSSSGVSISVPIGAGTYGGSISGSKSNINSDYASVNEQAGIKAGDAGFQVNVNGNTNLTGAVIASTQTAIDNNANSLTTKTLTTSDLQNKAEYTGEASSFSAGVGRNTDSSGNVKNTPSASAGFASEEGTASSITQSAISGGAVSITDNAQQTSKTGKDTTTTVVTLNRDVQVNAKGETVDSSGNSTAHTITPIFDQEKVNRELNAAVTITQAFSNVAPQAIASFAQGKADDLKTQADDAHKAGDLAKEAELRAEEAKWEEGGIYRVALHTALGGLITGDVSGALGAGTVASAAPLLNELQDKITDSLKSAGLSQDNAKILAQGVAELTSAGIGSTVGGTASAGAALAVDTNNRQLHPTEIDLIKKLAKEKAQASCNGDASCENKMNIAWTDMLERVAEGLVDDKANQQNLQYLAQVINTAMNTDSNGAWGGVEAYITAFRQAQNLLSTYNSQQILVNGKPIISDGAAQTYFSATEAQRADTYINTFLGQAPDKIIPAKAVREAEFLDYLQAPNGSATQDYSIEELIVGTLGGNVTFKLAAKAWTGVEVKLAGETVASATGNISAKQITESGIQATLTDADRMILGDIAKLPNTTLQGDAREIVVNNYFARNGFTSLDGKCGSNCFDGVFVKGDKVYVVETKPLNTNGTIQLNSEQGDLARQMSNDWINSRIKVLADSTDPALKNTAAIISAAIKNNSLVRVVAGADSKGVTFVRLTGN